MLWRTTTLQKTGSWRTLQQSRNIGFIIHAIKQIKIVIENNYFKN
jgi:hypothetical protein